MLAIPSSSKGTFHSLPKLSVTHQRDIPTLWYLLECFPNSRRRTIRAVSPHVTPESFVAENSPIIVNQSLTNICSCMDFVTDRVDIALPRCHRLAVRIKFVMRPQATFHLWKIGGIDLIVKASSVHTLTQIAGSVIPQPCRINSYPSTYVTRTPSSRDLSPRRTFKENHVGLRKSFNIVYTRVMWA